MQINLSDRIFALIRSDTVGSIYLPFLTQHLPFRTFASPSVRLQSLTILSRAIARYILNLRWTCIYVVLSKLKQAVMNYYYIHVLIASLTQCRSYNDIWLHGCAIGKKIIAPPMRTATREWRFCFFNDLLLVGKKISKLKPVLVFSLWLKCDSPTDIKRVFYLSRNNVVNSFCAYNTCVMPYLYLYSSRSLWPTFELLAPKTARVSQSI